MGEPSSYPVGAASARRYTGGMPARITRRSLALAALGAAAVEAQTPAASPQQELEDARKRLESNVEALRKVELPMATEPAFQFEA